MVLVNAHLSSRKTLRIVGSETQGGSSNKFFSKLWHGVRRKSAAELIAKGDALREKADRLINGGGSEGDKLWARQFYDDAIRLYKKAADRAMNPFGAHFANPVEAQLRLADCHLALGNYAIGACSDSFDFVRDGRENFQRAAMAVSLLLILDPKNEKAHSIAKEANEYLVKNWGTKYDTSNLIKISDEFGEYIEKDGNPSPDPQPLRVISRRGR